MDRYDRVIRDMQQKTEDRRLAWKVVSPARYERILVDPGRVIRTVASEYTLADKKFDLLFVERKTDLFVDSGEIREGRDFQVLVLDQDGEIVLSLYDGVV